MPELCRKVLMNEQDPQTVTRSYPHYERIAMRLPFPGLRLEAFAMKSVTRSVKGNGVTPVGQSRSCHFRAPESDSKKRSDPCSPEKRRTLREHAG